MKLYHGSTMCIPEPRLLPVNRRLDFGPGFYTTTDMQQARRWANIKSQRIMAPQAVVSVYETGEIFTSETLAVKWFTQPNEEWLDFVMINRIGDGAGVKVYDVIRGPVANDTLYETLTLFERGILTRTEAIVRLRTHTLADQVVFSTPTALASLRYESCVEATR
ncbi:MAG: DUF3990 domain-containing protein [bacterium]